MNRIAIFLLVLLGSAATLHAQNVTNARRILLFDETIPKQILPTQDGGYIISANSGERGDNTCMTKLIKFDADLNTVWHQTFGYSGECNLLNDLAEAENGDLILAIEHNTGSPNTSRPFPMLVRTNSMGDTLWASHFFWDETVSFADPRLAALDLMPDGSIVVVGRGYYPSPAEFRTHVARFDSSGQAMWYSGFRAANADPEIYDISTDSAGNIYLVGNEQYSLFVAKLDASGNNLWTIAFDTDQNSTEFGMFAEVIGDSALAIAGMAGNHTFIALMDLDGNSIYNHRLLDFDFNTADILGSFDLTQNGGFLLAGTMDAQIGLVKLDGNLNVQYAYAMQPYSNGDNRARAAVETGAGIVYLIEPSEWTGSQYESRTELIRMGYNGDFSCGVETNLNYTLTPSSFSKTPYQFFPVSSGSPGFRELFLPALGPLLIDSVTCTGPVARPETIALEEAFTLYPNPSSGELNFAPPLQSGNLQVYDFQGRQILSRTIESPLATLNLSDLATGVYLINYQSRKGSFSRKVVLE